MSQTPDQTAYAEGTPAPAQEASPEPVQRSLPSPRIDQNIEARTGATFEVREGEQILIRDWSGKQTCALVAFKRDDHDECLSTANTREAMGSIMLRKGMTLISNRRNWLLRLDEDTVGRHDLIMPACSRQRYREYYGLPDHANCRDNLRDALAPYGIAEDRIPDPVNIFMHMAILSKGELEARTPLSEPGDEVIFKALTDLIVAVSACPQDQDATNGFNPTDLLFRVFPNPDATPDEQAAPEVVDHAAETRPIAVIDRGGAETAMEAVDGASDGAAGTPEAASDTAAEAAPLTGAAEAVAAPPRRTAPRRKKQAAEPDEESATAPAAAAPRLRRKKQQPASAEGEIAG